MSLIPSNAVEIYDDRLAYHTNEIVNTAVTKQYYVDFQPTTPLASRSGTILFDISNNSEDFINLHGIYMTLGLIIKDDKGKNVTPTKEVTLQNFIAQTIFQRLEIWANNVNINSAVGSNFPYKVIFDILLEHGKQEQKAIYSMGGFEKDTAGYMDQYEQTNTSNMGLRERFKKTRDGKVHYFKSKIFHDICNQKKFLPNKIPVRLKTNVNGDRFNLMYKNPGANAAVKGYNISIETAVVSVPFVKLLPSYLGGYMLALKKEPDEIRFMKSEIASYNIAVGTTNIVIENLFQDRIPNKLILGFVDAEAYNGDNQKNGFNFQHMNIEDIAFEVDGQNVGSQRLTPNFSQKEWIDIYSNIFEGLNNDQRELPNLTYEDIGDGYAIFKFNLIFVPDESTLPLRKGHSRVLIRFQEALESAITLVAYTKFPARMVIDEPRNIFIEP